MTNYLGEPGNLTPSFAELFVSLRACPNPHVKSGAHSCPLSHSFSQANMRTGGGLRVALETAGSTPASLVAAQLSSCSTIVKGGFAAVRPVANSFRLQYALKRPQR